MYFCNLHLEKKYVFLYVYDERMETFWMALV